jgi:hypothetical protein
MVERLIPVGKRGKARGPHTPPHTSKPARAIVRIGLVASSYYAQRSARDPDWHAKQLREARQREARARERDPEGFAERRRLRNARYRARQAASGLTFHQLAQRCLLSQYVDAERTLRRVLREEVERGTIDYHSTLRRYELNGIDPALREALELLEL